MKSVGGYATHDFRATFRLLRNERSVGTKQTFRFCEICNTPKGASASATVYTMVEMAKAHLNIYDYLKFLLEHCPTAQMTDEELEQLAPWNENVKQICGNTGNREDLKM